MQKLSHSEIDSRFDQLCCSLKDGHRLSLAYSEAVYVANTFYRTFGRNMGEGVLSAIKNAVDAGDGIHISKSELKNILINAEEGSLRYEAKAPLVLQSHTPELIKREYKELIPATHNSTYVEPQVISTSQIYTTTSNDKPSRFTGSRKSIVFHSTLNPVEGSSYTCYEPKSVTDNTSTVRVVRTSNYTKTPYYNGEYRVVHDPYIKGVPTPSNLDDNRKVEYVTRTVREPAYEQHTESVLLNENDRNQNGNEWNGQEYSSKLQGFTIKYGDHNTKSNPYVTESTNGTVVYKNGVTYRRA